MHLANDSRGFTYRQPKPRVSIIIPVYNGEKYLDIALESALLQTYPGVEIIVVDDGSTDKTAEIAARYAYRVKYFYKKNGGCASALNFGLNKMQGRYFSWLSHDDCYDSYKITRQMQALYNLDNQNTIIYGGYDVVNDSGKRIGKVRPHKVLRRRQLNEPLAPLLRGLIHGCGLLIPKYWFDRVGTFNESLQTTQDYDLWFRMLREAPIHYIPEVLLESRVHPLQGTNTIPCYLEECNRLWIGFMEQLTTEEMIRLEGSERKFYRGMQRFLKKTPYSEAADYAMKVKLNMSPLV